MELRLYNTLTKEKEVFAPLDSARGVRMYVCGPTVYDFAHIGNARPVIVFDVLYRLLRQLYGKDKVKYVRNITDVDDKINARAAQEYPDLPLNEAIRLVTEKTEQQFHEDVDALGCLRPDVEPRATEHIAEMRDLIDRLVKAGFAYVEQDHVLFEVGKMNDYGRLARRSLDEMEAGARVEVAPYKRNPMDFVLWKPSKPNEPGWPSPAGITVLGRPGWHIECSAMSWKHLGETFDIHGGGIDLVFPHHENEIAQSRCAFHAPIMAKTWMHNGFLQVEGEKMSKSLGNFITIRQLLSDWKGYAWPGEALRFNMLRTHYRQPIDWTFQSLDDSHKTLWSWYELVQEVAPAAKVPSEILDAISDDLNTSLVITELHGLFRSRRLSELRSSLYLLGFSGKKENLHRIARAQVNLTTSGHLASQTAIVGGFANTGPSEIDKLVEQRNAARARKDWKESDRIRDELKAMGVVIKDNKDGTTTWEVAR
ncbi:MAG: cysteine--tRNA ligase [Xanthobacteraceae bacterium]|nr:cysteine--tRNA ligase [Xanthobacteraceae bacterium]MCW5674229.1 cysteine--tRNA ligase [Xanthobacteraceae bacterium]